MTSGAQRTSVWPLAAHGGALPRQAPALRSLSCLRFTPRNTNSFIYVFNVANGQLNELQLVIFMVNLKPRSCWLILLLGSKTGRQWCCCRRDPNRHLMLNYSHRPDPGAATLQARGVGLRGPEPTAQSPRSRRPSHPHPPDFQIKKPRLAPAYGGDATLPSALNPRREVSRSPGLACPLRGHWGSEGRRRPASPLFALVSWGSFLGSPHFPPFLASGSHQQSACGRGVGWAGVRGGGRAALLVPPAWSRQCV